MNEALRPKTDDEEKRLTALRRYKILDTGPEEEFDEIVTLIRFAVFTLPEDHRRRLRTSNPMERSVQQELKRRTVKVRVFPSDDALLRLVSAVLVEIDEKRASDTKAYIKWECQDA